MNGLDRLIAWISPRAGLYRHFARERLARAYEAASPRDKWKPRRSGASPAADHMADAATIRSKAHALVQNVPYVRAGLDALVAHTVGSGIVPRSLAVAQADVLDTLWVRWITECDADARLNMYGLQAAAYRAMEQDGEVLIRLRARRPSDNLAVPLQLQMLEIDWLDSTRTGASGGNAIVNGIEYDALGRAVAYYLWDQHPGDLGLLKGVRAQSRRIAADTVIHLFAPDRPGQGRGFSRLAPVIPRVRDLQLYEDAELARKNLETRLSVVASGDVSSMANPVSYGGTADTTTARTTGDLGELPSGGIIEVPPGVNTTIVAPHPAPGYVEYVKHEQHIIATALGVTYEMLTGDMKDTNFSSARVRQMDFRRQVEQRQWTLLIPNLCDRIWRAFVDAAALTGKVKRTDYAVDYSTPKWDYVNPEQDVRADQASIGAGLMTISEGLRRRGYNPEQVFAELRNDFERLKSDGTLDVLLFMQKGGVPQDAAATAGQADQQARLLDGIAKVLDRMDTRLGAMEQRAVVVNTTIAEGAIQAPTTIGQGAVQVDARTSIAEGAVQAPTQFAEGAIRAPDVHNHDHTHHHHPRGLVRKVPQRDAQGLVTRVDEEWITPPDADTTEDNPCS